MSHKPRHMIEPGEVALPVTTVRKGDVVPEDGHLVTHSHSIADVLRFLIACSDYEDVLATLQMMDRQE